MVRYSVLIDTWRGVEACRCPRIPFPHVIPRKEMVYDFGNQFPVMAQLLAPLMD